MNTIIIFIKAPIPGQVKTRLCPPLLVEQAARLYAAFAQDTLKLAERVPGAAVAVAYQPGVGFPGLEWLRSQPPVPQFLQRGQDLGERLTNAFERAFAGGAQKAVAIGSDTPQLNPGMIDLAFSNLETAEVTLGPADDGGYYLIGLKKARPGLFQAIPWSTDRVLEETLRRAKELGLKAATLPGAADIDTFAELTRLARKLRVPGADICPVTKQALKYMLPSGLEDETLAI